MNLPMLKSVLICESKEESIDSSGSEPLEDSSLTFNSNSSGSFGSSHNITIIVPLVSKAWHACK